MKSISSTFYARAFFVRKASVQLSLVTFSFVIFGTKILYKKRAQIALMKLTHVLYFPFSASDKILMKNAFYGITNFQIFAKLLQINLKLEIYSENDQNCQKRNGYNFLQFYLILINPRKAQNQIPPYSRSLYL